MCCEHLVCASCAGPVVEARCPVCRGARASMHHQDRVTLPPQLVAVLVTIALLLAVLAAHR